jgi:hypothetical protein
MIIRSPSYTIVNVFLPISSMTTSPLKVAVAVYPEAFVPVAGAE